ncbi:MAG: response regulator [Candidatus Omnitrophica bacterium]|nr:response regulator [Candidatus Omnitrophota bacterium]
MSKKILLVDDEKDFAQFLKLNLETHGYEADAAYDGEAAIDKVRKEKPDLIILDIMLPKIDGYRVCNMLRNEYEYRNIPIIMLTARSGMGDVAAGMEMGAISYISKPFRLDALLGIIDGIMGGSRYSIQY